MLGTPLMPWQQQVADTALEIDDAGRMIYKTVVLTVPRQSGKTTLLLALWLQRAVGFPNQRIVWTMQNAQAARKKWDQDHVPLMKASPLMAAVEKIVRQNGQEGIEFKNGSIQSLMSTTESAGHGLVVDLAIFDEAWALPDARLEDAIRPALITRMRLVPSPQLWIVSTAGTRESGWFRSKVDAGRATVESGEPSSMAYFEWSAAEDADPGDPATWRSCMPALGHTILEDSIRDEYRQMVAANDLAGFRRPGLNQWTDQKLDPAIPAAKWLACLDPQSEAGEPMVFAWDVSPLRDMSSICVAGRRVDGLEHGELVDHRPGVGWVAGRVADLVDRHHPAALVVDPMGPSGSLTDDVRRELDVRGLRVEIIEVTMRQHAQGCGQLFDAVCGEVSTLRHRGDPALGVAVEGAAKRTLGDAWAWARRTSSVDITPLVALTLARWGLGGRDRVVDIGKQVW